MSPLIPLRGPWSPILVIATTWLLCGFVLLQDQGADAPHAGAANLSTTAQPVRFDSDSGPDTALADWQRAQALARAIEADTRQDPPSPGAQPTEPPASNPAPTPPSPGVPTPPSPGAQTPPSPGAETPPSPGAETPPSPGAETSPATKTASAESPMPSPDGAQSQPATSQASQPSDAAEVRRIARENARRRAAELREQRLREMEERRRAASQAASRPDGAEDGAETGEEPRTTPPRTARRLGGGENRRESGPPSEEAGAAGEGDLTVSAPPAPADGRTEWFAFKDTQWEDVIQHFIERIGKPLMSGEDSLTLVSGTLTYESSRRYTKEEAIDELNHLLVEQGAFFAEDENYVYVVPLSELTKVLELGFIFDTLEAFETAKLRDYQLCSVQIQIKGRNAEEVRDLLSPSMPDYALPIVVGETNKIRISGLAKDVRRFVGLMEITSTRRFDPRETRFIEIKTNVRQIEQMVREYFSLDQPQRVFNPQTRRFEQPASTEPAVQFVADERTKTLIVKAPVDKLDEIAEFIQKVDAKPDIGEFKTTVLPVQHGNAGEIADLLNKIFEQEQGSASRSLTRTVAPQVRPGTRRTPTQQNQPNPEEIVVEDLYERARKTIRLFAHEPTNSLIVYANDDGVKRVQEMLEGIDQPTPSNYRAFKLEHASATEIQPLVEQIARGGTSSGTPGRNTGGSRSITILPDPSTDTLYVLADRSEMERIAGIIAQFDVPAEDDARHVIELVTITADRAAELANAVLSGEASRPRAGGRGRGGAAVVPATARVIPLREANMLIVVCGEEEWAKVEETIRQADQNALSSKPELEFIPVTKGSVDAIVATLRQMYPTYRHPVLGQVPVFIDTLGDQIVVQSVKPAIEEITALVSTLDREVADVPFTILPLEQADATTVADYAQGLLPAAQRGPRGGGAAPTSVRAEPVTNSLIIQADKLTVKKITDFAREMDSKVAGQQPERKFYTLKNATPQEVVTAISSLFDAAALSRRGGRGPVGAQVRTVIVGNQVVVDAPAGKQAEIESLIDQLDSLNDRGITTLLVKLPGADTNAIAARLASAFQDRMRTQAVVARFQPDASTETILMTVSKDVADEASRLLEEYRAASEPIVQQTEFLALQHAAAPEAAAWLQEQLVNRMIAQFGRTTAERVRVTPETRTNRIIVSAPQVAVTAAKQLLEQYDVPITVATEASAPPVETIVRKLPGLDVANLAQQLTQAAAALPPRPDKLRFVFGADRMTETLIYTIPKDSITWVDENVGKFTAESAELMPEQRNYPIRNTDATYLTNQLNSVLGTQVRNKRGQDVWAKVSITPETRLNEVIVNAPKFVHEMVARLLEQLDKPSTADSLKTVTLLNADANTVLNTLRSLYDEKIRARTLRISAEPLSNSLIVGGREDDFNEIKRWAVEFDQSATARSKIEFFQLDYVDASQVVQLVRDMVAALRGVPPGSKSQTLRDFTVQPDLRTNRLVVSAPEQVLADVRTVVKQVDVPGPDDNVVTIDLKYADPGDVQRMLNEVFGVKGSKRNQNPAEEVYVTTSNMTLIIKAPKRKLEQITALVAKLDAQNTNQLQTKLYTLRVLNAQTVAGQVNLFLAGIKKNTKRGELQPAAFAEPNTNTLVVIAPGDQIPFIDGLVEKIEATPLPTSEPKAFALKNVRADQVAQSIQQMLRSKVIEREGARQNAVQVSVIPEAYSNRVFVYAPSEYQDLAAEIVRMIDQSVETGDVLHIIRLDNADAAQLQQTLMTYLQQRQQRGAAQSVQISVDASSNSLLISGRIEDVANVEKTIAQLDTDAASVPELQIFQLDYANADDLAETLPAMFPPRGPGDTVTVNADSYYSRLYVTANKRRMRQVEAVIKQYDAAPPSSETGLPGGKDIYFIEITRGDPLDIEMDVEDFFPPESEGGPRIDADFFGNWITVVCRKDEYPKIEELIRKFEARAKPEFKITRYKPKGDVSRYIEFLKARELDADIVLPAEGAKPESMIEELWPEGSEHPAVGPKPAGPQPTSAATTGALAPRVVPRPQFQLASYQPASGGAARADTQNRVDEAAAAALGQEPPAGSSKRERPQVRVHPDGSVIITGLKDDVEDIEDAFELFEEDMGEGEVIRIFKFKYGDVNAAARVIDLMFNEQQRGIAQIPGVQQAGQQAGQRGGRGQIPGLPGAFGAAFGADAGRRGQRGEGGEEDEMMNLARQLMGQGADATGGRGGMTGGSGRVRYATDASHNYLIIKCDESKLPEIRQLLRELDIPGAKVDVKVFQLKNVAAKEAAENIKALLGVDRSQQSRQQQQSPFGAMMRNPLNPLGSQFLELFQQQQVSIAGGEGTSAKIELVEIVPNEITNSILVSAPAEVMRIIEDLIGRLERLEGHDITVIRHVALEKAKVDEVVPLLREIFTSDGRGGGGGRGAAARPGDMGPVTVSADPRNNSIIYSAQAKDVTAVEAQIRMLDIEDKDGALANAEMIICDYGDAVSIADTVTAIYGASGGGAGPRGGRGGSAASSQTDVRITAEPVTNSILVFAPKATRELIIDDILKLDQQSKRGVREIDVKHADAQKLADRVAQMFGGTSVMAQAGGGGGLGGRRGAGSAMAATAGRLVIVGDKNAGKLLVRAPDALFEQIKEVVATLDTPDETLQVRRFALTYVDSQTVVDSVKGALSEFVQMRAMTGDSGDMGLDAFTAVADPRTNSILVVGSEQTFGFVELLISQVDRETPPDLRKTFQIFVLDRADAQTVADAINSFASGGAAQVTSTSGGSTRSGAGRRGGFSGFGGAGGASLQASDKLEVSAVAEPLTNSVMVFGRPADIERVDQEIIQQLDRSQRSIVELPVNNATASQVAASVMQFMDQPTGTGGGGRGGQARGGQPPTIIPNDLGKKIVVRGTRTQIAEIKELVERFDNADAGSPVRVVRVPYGQDVVALAQTLERVINEGENQIARANGRQPRLITVAADERTQSLLVYGDSSQYAVVESVVQELTEGRLFKPVTQVITLENLSATEAQQIIDSMQQRGGGVSGSGTRPRQPSFRGTSGTSTGGTRIQPQNPQQPSQPRNRPSGGGSGNRPSGGGARPSGGGQQRPSGTPGALWMAPMWERLLSDDSAEQTSVGGRPFIGTFVTHSLINAIWMARAAQDALDAGQDEPAAEAPGQEPPASQPPDTEPEQRVPEPAQPPVAVERRGEPPATEIRRPAEPAATASAPVGSVLGELRGSVVAQPLNSRQLMIVGDASDVDFIQQLLMQMDGATPQAAIEVYNLKFAKAAVIAPVIDNAVRAFVEANVGTLERLDRFSIVAEARSNSLIVAASDSNLQLISQMIAQLDVEAAALGASMKLVPLVHVQAAEAVSLLRPMLEALAKFRNEEGGTIPSIQAEPRSNSLTIIGTAADIAEIEQQIEAIDVELTVDSPFTTARLVVVDLVNANAEKLAETLNSLIEVERATSAGGGGGGPGGARATQALIRRLLITTADGQEMPPLDLDKPIQIQPEPGKNSLLIRSNPTNNEALTAIVKLFDALPAAAEYEIKSFRLQYASAAKLTEMLQKTFDDARKNVLKRPSDGDSGIKQGVLPPQPAGAAARGLPYQISITNDPRSNVIVAVGHKDAVMLAAGLVAEMDKPAGELDVKPYVVNLKNTQATRLKEQLDEMLQARLEALGDADNKARDSAVITADDRTNSLLVVATADMYEMVWGLVGKLDTADSYRVVDTLYRRLKFADSGKLSGMMQELFDRKKEAAGETETQTKDVLFVLSDTRSNSLMLTGTRDYLREAEALIDRLDQQFDPTVVFKVRPILLNSATTIAALLTDMVEKSRSNQEEATQGTPIHIAADARSNSLLIACSNEDLLMVERWVELLDRPTDPGRVQKIIPLKRGKAEEIAQSASELFKSSGDGAGQDVTVFADPATNSLIAVGPPAVVKEIEDLVDKLNAYEAGAGAMVRIFKLKQADAEDAGELLRRILSGEGGSVGGTGAGGGGATNQDLAAEQVVLVYQAQHPELGAQTFKALRNEITVIDDLRTNSLICTAPPEGMPLVEQLVAAIDLPPDALQMRVFPLRNSDAEEMVTMLEKLFETQGTTGGTSTTEGGERELVLTDGPGGRQVLRFTTERRTNSVIAAGTESYLNIVDQLVLQLDSQPIQERRTIVYHPRNNPALAIQDAMSSFNDENKRVLDEVGQELSATARQQEEILTVANEDTNRVIINYDPRKEDQVLNLVKELDQPPPQVLIQVLILELRMDNSLELGVEFAFQDLQFTAAGPSDTTTFDYVGGTDIGAAGADLGGFTFTITGADFNFLFRTLQEENRLSVLSRPQITAMDNQEASFEVTDSVPFVGQSTITNTGQVTTSVDRRDVGIRLTVTPHINPDGLVRMEIRQEVSDFSGSTVSVGPGVTSPVFFQRIAETVVTVKDAETVVLGGLITTRDEDRETKVPLLGDVPGLGLLFRNDVKTQTRSELLLVLTPHVIRTVDDFNERSITERDRLEVIPPEILSHPLMQGLRVAPEDLKVTASEELLGPFPLENGSVENGAAPGARPEDTRAAPPASQQYGPPPRQPEATPAGNSYDVPIPARSGGRTKAQT